MTSDILHEMFIHFAVRRVAGPTAKITKQTLPAASDERSSRGRCSHSILLTFMQQKAFINNAIPLSALAKAMKLGKLGIQICIKSETAFSRLAFMEAIAVDGEEYFIRRSTRDRKVREDYLKLLEESNDRYAIYIMDIIRQDWKIDDERLQ